MPDEPVTIPLSDHERALLLRILTHFANLLAKRLIERGMSRKLIVREARGVIQEMFPGSEVVDVRTLMGDPE